MKRLLVLCVCACSSFVVNSESTVLPPVVDHSIYPKGSTSVVPVPSVSANVIYEVLGRLEQLQQEVQQLRGIVEQQSQKIVVLKKRQSNIYSDLDLRLQALSGGGSQEKLAGLVETGGAMSEGVMSAVSESAARYNVVNYPVPETDQSGIVEKVGSLAQKNQKALYQAAYDTLRNGHNTQAIAKFTLLLTEFPKGEFADNSQYWLAEAYKANHDLNAAKAAFGRVVSHFEGSAKVPGALLKLGYIELEQNNKLKAKDYLTQVMVSYPDTTAAHLATKKLIQMGIIHP